MASHRKSTTSNGRPSSSVLRTLRDVQIIDSKPVLPAEILAAAFEYLPAPDLIRCARASKLMRAMIYDDRVWVRRLQRMGCWNEAAARATVEKSSATVQHAARSSRHFSQSSRQSVPNSVTSMQSTPSLMLTEPSSRSSVHLESKDALNGQSDGFSEALLSPTSSGFDPLSVDSSYDPESPLCLLENTRSIRGHAREEFGRLYAAYGPFYRDALRTKNPSNAKVFRVYRDPKQQAQMLNQIIRFEKNDSPLGRQQRKERLSAIMAAFEEAVTNEFQVGISSEDFDGRMKKYAEVLVILNGGQKAVDEFLSANPLLSREASLGDPSDCISSTDPDCLFVEEIHAFFSHLSSACQHQLSIIRRVFPQSIDVSSPLLERIAKSIISPYANKLFDLAHQRSTEAYLRAVSCTFEEISDFKTSLKIPPASQQASFEKLDDIISEIFSLHFDTYLAAEQAFFKRRSDAEVTGWERQLTQQDSSLETYYMSNVNRQADKRDFMSSFKQVFMMPVNVFQFGGTKTSAPSTQIASSNFDDGLRPESGELSRTTTPVGGSSPGRSNSPLSEPPVTALAAKAAIMKSRLEGISSLFSLEVALNLVHMAKSSIERISVFAIVPSKFEQDAKDRCEAIFTATLKTVGTRHVQAGFDKAIEHLTSYNPREHTDRDGAQAQVVAPLAMFLELVNVGDLIQQMIDVFFEQELVARRLTDKNDFLRPTLKEKKKFEQMLDDRVAAGLNKGIEVLMAEVEYQFASTQTTEDYNPEAAGDSSKMFEIGPSKTAVAVVELLSNHTKMLVGSTDKQLLDVFNQEIGLRLYTAFCKHLKRQRVSVTGSLTLISDINHFSALIKTFRNKDLMDYYNALRELSQIYLVGPENAKELATIVADTDRFRGIMRPEEVYEFAERRADWYQIRARVEKAMYGVGCCMM